MRTFTCFLLLLAFFLHELPVLRLDATVRSSRIPVPVAPVALPPGKEIMKKLAKAIFNLLVVVDEHISRSTMPNDQRTYNLAADSAKDLLGAAKRNRLTASPDWADHIPIFQSYLKAAEHQWLSVGKGGKKYDPKLVQRAKEGLVSMRWSYKDQRFSYFDSGDTLALREIRRMQRKVASMNKVSFLATLLRDLNLELLTGIEANTIAGLAPLWERVERISMDTQRSLKELDAENALEGPRIVLEGLLKQMLREWQSLSSKPTSMRDGYLKLQPAIEQRIKLLEAPFFQQRAGSPGNAGGNP